MATKTHTQKDGTVWEWEETSEIKEWISLQNAKNVMMKIESSIEKTNSK